MAHRPFVQPQIRFAVALASLLSTAAALAAPALPVNFQETVVLRGLRSPTAVRFARDGRVFVAEKAGLLKVFDGLDDTTAEVFVDLTKEVNSYWDRGLLGLALHPSFPEVPYVFVLYTYDAGPGGTAPQWNDSCEDGNDKGCVVTSRLARLEASADGKRALGQTVLVSGQWCQQFPSHGVGDLSFGPDGALYVSAGDGASFTKTDIGQHGSPANPCDDPKDQGGALRAQDLLTTGDPVSFDGAVLRLDPMTGAPLPTNPLSGDEAAIIAFGLRNPYRMAFRPGTRELWIGDVGASTWEELNRIGDVSDGAVENFGWPCYEGRDQNGSYRTAGVCPDLYAGRARVGTAAPAAFAYRHDAPPDVARCAGEESEQAAVSGLAFYGGMKYPPAYRGALVFADYSKRCIWAMQPGESGAPDPGRIVTLVADAAKPVALEAGPDGDLFYVDHEGTIRRIVYSSTNRPPRAAFVATPPSGLPPLAVTFDASTSSDPDAGDALSYAWDLDGDGAFDDGSSDRVSFTYERAGSFGVTLRVTDREGATATHQATIDVANTPPMPVILGPGAGLRWRVGEAIAFSGAAMDMEDGALLPARFEWSLVIQHCVGGPNDCHAHQLETFAGVTGGSFKAPDHEAPSYLELSLTVTDTAGVAASVKQRLDPIVATLTLATDPPGLPLLFDADSRPSPIEKSLIAGAELPIEAPELQTVGGESYVFSAWSDGGARRRTLRGPDVALTLTARYVRAPTGAADAGFGGAGGAAGSGPAHGGAGGDAGGGHAHGDAGGGHAHGDAGGATGADALAGGAGGSDANSAGRVDAGSVDVDGGGPSAGADAAAVGGPGAGLGAASLADAAVGGPPGAGQAPGAPDASGAARRGRGGGCAVGGARGDRDRDEGGGFGLAALALVAIAAAPRSRRAARRA